jgi:major membrane immunogen (membrane-anchored lipoprotein)
VHIAYWFTKQNDKIKSTNPVNQEKVKGKKSKASEGGTPKAAPQVLYCGPSNKSVDVVTGTNVYHYNCRVQTIKNLFEFVLLRYPYNKILKLQNVKCSCLFD